MLPDSLKGRAAALPGTDPPETPQSLLGVVQGIDARVRSGETSEFETIPTGFKELDQALSGGFKLGQLALLSGPAGVGKTSLLLQIARNIASGGRAGALFVCYEHEADYLARRLICMESVVRGDGSPSDGLRLRDMDELVTKYGAGQMGKKGFIEAVCMDARGATAIQRINQYGSNLLLVKGTSHSTTIEAISQMVTRAKEQGGPASGKPLVLFVDYLQKIASETSHRDQLARNIEEVEGLKELALQQHIVVVAIVAAEVEGLKAQRVRMQHLLNSPLIAYEADVVMLMNEKYDIVDRRHIQYNPHQAEQFHQYVVLSVEKNRAGSDFVDLELKKQLQYCLFRPEARRVEEQLVASRARE